MGLESRLGCVTLDVIWNAKKDTYTFGGNARPEARYEIISGFLRWQMGAGRDTRKPNRRDVYKIRLKLYTENDEYVVSHNTGNLGFRDGILLSALEKCK